MSRRRAFTVTTGICPTHGKIEVPFYEPPLSRDADDRLSINLSDPSFAEDFAIRTSCDGLCRTCSAPLSYDYFADDPERRRAELLDLLVWKALSRHRHFRGLSPDQSLEGIATLVRTRGRRLRVELNPAFPIKASPYLDALTGRYGSDTIVPTLRSQVGAVGNLSYSEFEKLNSEQKREFTLRLLDTQLGKCALCDELLDTRRQPGYMGPIVDHNHKTGHIRGVLHPACNLDLNVVENRPAEWHAMARDYLRRNAS